MTHVEEFHRADRKVILLTYREGEALYAVIKDLTAPRNSDVARAREVLRNQLTWIKARTGAT